MLSGTLARNERDHVERETCWFERVPCKHVDLYLSATIVIELGCDCRFEAEFAAIA